METHINKLAASGDTEALFQIALILWGQKRYKDAYDAGVLAANNHHVRAKWLVGFALLTGKGCDMDQETANRLFTDAAKLGGHPKHLGSLGILLKRATEQFEQLEQQIRNEYNEQHSQFEHKTDRSAEESLRVAYNYMFTTGVRSSPHKAYAALLSANLHDQSDPHVKIIIGILSATFNKSDYLDHHVNILRWYELGSHFTHVKLIAENGRLGRTYAGFVKSKPAILVEPPINHQNDIVALLRMCVDDPHLNNIIAPVALTANVPVEGEKRCFMPIALCYVASLDAKPVNTAMIENIKKFPYFPPGVTKRVRYPQQLQVAYGNVSLLLNLMLGVAKGLAYMHQNAMPHGDVSLHNMYINTNNYLGMIATKPHFSWQRPRTTPETLKGITPYTIDSDIFEFGAAFINMLTKDYWRTKVMKSVATLEAAAATGYQDVRAQMPKWCASALVDILLRCLGLDPLQRPNMQCIVGLLQKLILSEKKQISLEAKEKNRQIREFNARFFPKTDLTVGQRHQKGDALGEIYFEPNLDDPDDHRARFYIFEKKEMPIYPKNSQQCSGESSECTCERAARPKQPRLITGTPAKEVKHHMGRQWGVSSEKQLSWIGLFLNKEDRLAVAKVSKSALNWYRKFSQTKAAALPEEKNSEEAVKFTAKQGA